jgi:predicted enzyme related to lactoylglutathione lyase
MGRVVHFEIHADDVDRAERFYRDVFGWDVQRFAGGAVDYRLVTTGPPTEPGIDGAITQRRASAQGAGIIAFVCTVQVDDLAETAGRIAAAGGLQVVDPETIPEVGRVAYYQDTEGNLFGLIEPDA